MDIIQSNEIINVDDVDLISKEKHRDINKIQKVLHRYHLKVNTEFSTIKRDMYDWKNNKNVGPMLEDKKDIQR